MDWGKLTERSFLIKADVGSYSHLTLIEGFRKLFAVAAVTQKKDRGRVSQIIAPRGPAYIRASVFR